MPKLKNLLLSFIVAFQLFVPLYVSAAEVGLPCTPPKEQSQNNEALFTCVNQVYKYALVICSIAAIFMIILGGYMYIFSGGNEKRVATAKSFISTSLIGIVVLLAGFLLLKQINPDLLTIRNITPQQIGQVDWYVIKAEDGLVGVGGTGGGSGGSVVKDCPGGQLVDIPRSEFDQYDNNKTCPIVLEALRKLKVAATAAGVTFKVNDSFDLRPGGKQQHSSSCHEVSGTCVDIGLSGNTTWDKLCAVVNSTGLFRLLNESKQTSANCGAYVATSKSSGPHLHLNVIQ